MSVPPNLAEVLGKINDGICVLNARRQISFINEKASQILDGADEAFDKRLSEAMTEHIATRFEYFHVSLNRWYEHHTYPNGDNGLTLISCDVTSRHRMEEALRTSEERFRRLIESNIIGVIVIADGLINEANDVFLNMLGYTRSDLIYGQLRWADMTPPEFDVQDSTAHSELASTGVLSPYEKELLRKDGSPVPVLVGGVATQETGTRPETLCLVLDLRERRRADERIRSMVEGGKILASSLECENTFPALAGFISTSLGASCLIFVEEAGRLICMAAAHTTVQPLESDESDLTGLLIRVLQSGNSEMTLAPASRALVPIVAQHETAGVLVIDSVKPDAFDDDDLRLFEGFGRRIGIALENSRLYHETQKANRLKDEFVAVISHELRTPLTPILGGVYMMRHEPHDEKVVRRALDLIERNAKTQVKLVDNLLDVSRALNGRLRLNVRPVDLCHVIQAAVETVRPASEAKGIRIDVRMDSISGIVSGDSDRLQQVVWNLLANSVQFTPHSGRITVELIEKAGQAEIHISDTGTGIEADFLPYVFDKFRQADASRTRPHAGLGLGLAIVRHLVESHGGTVQASSLGGQRGATLIVRLPLRPEAQNGTTD